TMGLFSGERSRGTLETLLAAPVSERNLTLSKFGAAFALVCVAIAFASATALIYLRLAVPPPEFARAEIFGALFICVLAAAVWTAAGTFFSALSYHQAPSCVATLALALGSASLLTRSFPGFTGEMFPDLADFARGAADTRVIFAAITLTVFLLTLATRVMQLRRCGK
ncbi:MAG: ABC transporter permease subunit, partial [Kiritimatiellaeota bacterium]|nr:ABC transporter permease subunit [Kiritimatiellota bacterium]